MKLAVNTSQRVETLNIAIAQRVTPALQTSGRSNPSRLPEQAPTNGGFGRGKPPRTFVASSRFEQHRALRGPHSPLALGLVHRKTVLAFVLRQIERLVGGGDQPLGVGADNRRPLCHADRGAN